nr:EamA family transporter [Kallotenue papyrolyticum]
MFMLSALRTGPTALVSAIASLNVLLLLLYGKLALRESFTRPELAGMALALSGVVLLRLFG